MSRRANELNIEADLATSAEMLRALIETNKTQACAIEAQARALETLKTRLEVEAAQARDRQVEQAALLGEARHELAEKAAALEIEKVKREAAERSLAEHEAFAAVVRVALPPATKPIVSLAPAEAPESAAKEPTADVSACAPGRAAAFVLNVNVASDGHGSSEDDAASGPPSHVRPRE